MIITKDVLKNLKLKDGKISEKRCQEINAMKIENPYYPFEYFSCKKNILLFHIIILPIQKMNV